jgi:orotate phosphoribosyltransferase
MKPIIPLPGEDLLELGKRCDAVYICPKVGSVRKGPLVVYAGKDLKGRNYFGDIYFNFRKIEEHQRVVRVYAQVVVEKLQKKGLLDTFDTVVGLPEGGRSFGQMVALIADKRFTYATKKPKPTEEGKKQEYEWDLSQFEFEQGEDVAIVDDVFNNFNNTDITLTEIAASGAKVRLLIGALHRSPVHGVMYVPKSGPLEGRSLPVIASIREVYPEYEQDHPEVADDIAAGNVELEVKKKWPRLLALMRSNS